MCFLLINKILMKKVSIVNNINTIKTLHNYATIMLERGRINANGSGDMVVMRIKTYEEKLERIEMYENILEGLTNIKEGKVVEGIGALNGLKSKYGL